MSRRLPDGPKVLWRSAVLAPTGPSDSTARLVACVMAEFVNSDGEMWPSASTIGERAALSERTVRSAMKRLHAEGWLTMVEPGGCRNGRRTTRWRVSTPGGVAGVEERLDAEGAEGGAEVDQQCPRSPRHGTTLTSATGAPTPDGASDESVTESGGKSGREARDCPTVAATADGSLDVFELAHRLILNKPEEVDGDLELRISRSGLARVTDALVTLNQTTSPNSWSSVLLKKLDAALSATSNAGRGSDDVLVPASYAPVTTPSHAGCLEPHCDQDRGWCEVFDREGNNVGGAWRCPGPTLAVTAAS